MNIEWLEPWCADQTEQFHESFKRQLELEVSVEHPLYGLQTRIVARGNGDDALFTILDESGRFAVVHLTWSQSEQCMPWPVTDIYPSLAAFVTERMIPDHKEFNRA